MDNKMKMLYDLKQRYSKRENIINFLKDSSGEKVNSVSDILISYDLQAGSYIRGYNRDRAIRDRFAERLAGVLSDLGQFSSLLEAGVGEAVTLRNVLERMNQIPNQIYGFDLSWSRVKYGMSFMKGLNLEASTVKLFTGDLFASPFADDSIDVVYTVHAIEPNGGREVEALSELYRITRKYLIILEPTFELADEESRQRMLSYGYVTNLYRVAKDLGYDVIEHRLFDVSLNPLNPTGIIVIRKPNNGEMQLRKESNSIRCPITKAPLRPMKSVYYSQESMLAYPILDGIPCLLPQNAIVATHFMDFVQEEEDEQDGI